MVDDTRRNLLKKAATLGVGIMVSRRDALARSERLSEQTGRNAAAPDFFPGFKQLARKTSGDVTINFVTAGSGPPLLLLHGYPETHVMWRNVAPQLARKFTVVAADLRRYGDSGKPAGGENHIGYSKRAMAQDQVDVMNSLGFDKFFVVGHDRGGRVAHRMALDHADSVQKLAVLDIVPTYKVFHGHEGTGHVQFSLVLFNSTGAAAGDDDRQERRVLAAIAVQCSSSRCDRQGRFCRISVNVPHSRGDSCDLRGLPRERFDRYDSR